MTKKAKPRTYKALVTLWVTKESRYALPGEIVELDLPASGIKRLVETGAIELVTQPVTTEEINHGEISTNGTND
jgi:hypothetical protein